MPKSLSSMKRTVENIKDPLYRFFEREVNLGCKILNMVRMDLKDIYMICRGEKKQTNDHRKLISDLTRGIIPKSWKVDYKIPRDTTVNQWINDFCQRARQLDEISRTVSSNGASLLRSSTVWLGGLFNPEAYITATRQCVAQANSWSLEELYLDIYIGNNDDTISMDDKKQERTINLPVYLNATRSDVLFTADFAVSQGENEQVYYQRGVALIASTTLN